MKQSLALLMFFAILPSAMAAEKPNIILILADDLGYADLGANDRSPLEESDTK